ncbi:hypothetical protein G9A89_004983 [Geosiphon pyriformis]|nr:hypothetical protein G9A89_004983 [Geosiphon pyriformis]
MASAKVKDTLSSKILKIKNNPPEPVKTFFIPNPDAFLDIKAGLEKFYEHYQNLTSIQEKQEQHLEKINRQLCNHCLILCDFKYCNKYDFIYNLPSHIIYIILEEKEPISNCTLKSESNFNPNSNSDNDDNENNSFSSVQNSNYNNNNLNSNSNPEQYIMLFDLTKEQELK